jgi:heme exporter protein A
MNHIQLKVDRVSKEFNYRWIFRDVSFSLELGHSHSITGKNGAGKSTLIKIIAQVLTPTKGLVDYHNNGKKISKENVKHIIGLVSPYLQLYDEFTAVENIRFLSEIRTGGKEDAKWVDGLFKRFELIERKDDLVRTYSSGMKQRLKYIFALMHHPKILLLDEPTSNLDESGVSIVKEIVQEQKEQGILIIATNDIQESQWCESNTQL